MKIRTGDLLAAYHPGSMATVIPVSCDVDKKTLVAIMGTGIGKKAGKTWTEVPRNLGKLIDIGGAHTYVVPCTRQPNEWTVCIPITYTYQQRPEVTLIQRCAQELVALADIYGWEKVFVPRLGCGGMGLDWMTQVRPILKPIFDDRFVIVHMDEPEPPKVAPKTAVKVGAVSKAARKRMEKKT